MQNGALFVVDLSKDGAFYILWILFQAICFRKTFFVLWHFTIDTCVLWNENEWIYCTITRLNSYLYPNTRHGLFRLSQTEKRFEYSPPRFENIRVIGELSGMQLFKRCFLSPLRFSFNKRITDITFIFQYPLSLSFDKRTRDFTLTFQYTLSICFFSLWHM